MSIQQKPCLATIVNFCTNEARFLTALIEQCREFSRQIIIPVCDHFFDGTPENRALLEAIYVSFPDCLFVEFPFIPNQIPRRALRYISLSHFWHSAARRIGHHFIDESIQFVLFLDADEVPDGKEFADWLQTGEYQRYNAMKLANYWYFREARFQALRWEDSIVLAQRSALLPSMLLQERERDAIYDLLPGPKRRGIMSVHEHPMFHHFSWVRTKEEMMKKVMNWGHCRDRDWVALVEKEFSAPFCGTDFVHGYSYRECDPPVHISMNSTPFFPRHEQPPQIIRLSPEKELSLLYPNNLKNWFWGRVKALGVR